MDSLGVGNFFFPCPFINQRFSRETRQKQCPERRETDDQEKSKTLNCQNQKCGQIQGTSVLRSTDEKILMKKNNTHDEYVRNKFSYSKKCRFDV